MTSKRRTPNYFGRSTIRGDDDILIAGFDVETKGLGGELLSIQTGVMGEIEFDCSPDMVSNFYAKLFKYPYPCVWFGHFAQYDWRYLMDALLTMEDIDFEISMRNDNDIYQITIRKDKKKYIMRDSYALWNSPLAKLATSFCPEIPKLDIDFEKVTFDVTNPQHIEYAKRDVQILITGLPRLFAMLKLHFGVNPNATFASTSLKGWQWSLPDEEKYDTSKLDARELFIRQSYYGGLVFLTDTNRHKDCETYDINSSYPYVMCAYGVPYGRCIESSDYHDERMGIYRVRVKAPDNLRIPILPARDTKGSMRWFSGEFETVVTNRELIFAANHGYEILEIYEGLVWEDTVYPFTDYIEKCKKIRKEFGKGPDMPMAPEEYLAKFMQNSLYGKFGSRRERRRVFAAKCVDEFELIGATAIDADSHWYFKKEIDDEMRTKPEWAVFITAHARLRLLQAAYSAGVDNVIYGDTDSLTIKSGCAASIDKGDEYGQFKLEKRWSEFRAIAPKVYAGIRIMQDGSFKRVGAAKGLPKKNLKESHWQQLLENGKTQSEVMSLDSLRLSLKRGVKPAQLLMRVSSTLENSINYELLTDGRVKLKIAA